MHTLAYEMLKLCSSTLGADQERTGSEQEADQDRTSAGKGADQKETYSGQGKDNAQTMNGIKYDYQRISRGLGADKEFWSGLQEDQKRTRSGLSLITHICIHSHLNCSNFVLAYCLCYKGGEKNIGSPRKAKYLWCYQIVNFSNIAITILNFVIALFLLCFISGISSLLLLFTTFSIVIAISTTTRAILVAFSRYYRRQ